MSNIDDIFADISEESTGHRLDVGTYEGTVVSAEVTEGRAPWVDTQLTVNFQTDDGGYAYADIELAPCLGPDGQISPGKVKFLRWQMQALGIPGAPSEVAQNLAHAVGNVVAFEVAPQRSGKINEKTGKPYTETVAKSLVNAVELA